MPPFDFHFSPTSASCRLAILDMSPSTVINLVTHLHEQSIMEGANIIRMEITQATLLLQHLFDQVLIHSHCNINTVAVSGDKSRANATTVVPQIRQLSGKPPGIELVNAHVFHFHNGAALLPRIWTAYEDQKDDLFAVHSSSEDFTSCQDNTVCHQKGRKMLKMEKKRYKK